MQYVGHCAGSRLCFCQPTDSHDGRMPTYINQDDTVRIPNYISPFDTVDDISGAMSIAATDEPSYMAAYAVILKDGSLLTWGNNEYYQLGRSDSTAYPQKILSDIVSVSCGTVQYAWEL